MIPNGDWMRHAPDNAVFQDAFPRLRLRLPYHPVNTMVTVVNCFYRTGSITRRTLAYVILPASYFLIYVYPSLKDATNFALDSMLDVALECPPLRWICPIDDDFNPFDGLDVRFANRIGPAGMGELNMDDLLMEANADNDHDHHLVHVDRRKPT